MTNAGFFRGTSAEQDFRFSNKQNKSRKEFKYPPIDTSKINIESLKPWILDRIKNVLENNDDLMSDAILEFFAEKEVDGSAVSQFISGFADLDKTSKFMQEVWSKFNEVNEDTTNNQHQDDAPKEKTKPIEDKIDVADKTIEPSKSNADALILLKPFLKRPAELELSGDSSQPDNMSISDDDRSDAEPSNKTDEKIERHKEHHRDRHHRSRHKHREHHRHKHGRHHRDHERDKDSRRRKTRDRRDRDDSRSRSRDRLDDIDRRGDSRDRSRGSLDDYRDRSRERRHRSRSRSRSPESRRRHKHSHSHKHKRRHKESKRHKHSRD